jgi:tetratricopeptide (TPR) repeat protein
MNAARIDTATCPEIGFEKALLKSALQEWRDGKVTSVFRGFVAVSAAFATCFTLASEQKKQVDECMKEGGYDEKTSCLFTVLQEEPENVFALFTLHHERERSLEQGVFLQELDRLIEMRPNLAHLYLLRADLKRKHWGDEEGANADLEIAKHLDSLPDLRRSEAERPIEPTQKNAPEYLARARARFFLGDYQGTVEDCNTYLRLAEEPYLPVVYDYLCSSKVAMGEIEEAIDVLSIKLGRFPEYSDSTLYRRAKLKRRMGDESGALMDEEAAQRFR